MTEPLWNNEQIEQEVYNCLVETAPHHIEYELDKTQVEQLMFRMRDEYEAELARLRATSNQSRSPQYPS